MRLAARIRAPGEGATGKIDLQSVTREQEWPERRREYRALFRSKLDEAFVDGLRAATNGGWAQGGERFRREIAKAAKRRVAPLPKGRRRKGAKNKRQLSLL